MLYYTRARNTPFHIEDNGKYTILYSFNNNSCLIQDKLNMKIKHEN